MDYENKWMHKNIAFESEHIEDYEGFVYLITNTDNGKQYIGKKSFWERRKDRKTGRRKTKESGWKNYYSSCDPLNEDVKTIGKDKFTREILYLCKYKKAMSYHELKEQFIRNVIESEKFYNTNISGKYFFSEYDKFYKNC